MKIVFAFLGGMMMILANNLSAAELRIKVSNIDVERGGNIAVMLFSEDGFPKQHDKAYYVQTKINLKEEMEFTFDVSLKELAIKVHHDENGDGKVTKNWTGIIPKDGLGFSNKQKITMAGAPEYKSSKLSKEKFKKQVNISVIYDHFSNME